MMFPEEWGAGGGGGGPTESKLVPLSMQSNEALLIKTLLARSCPSARLSRVQRVQNKMLWRAYANYRDDQLVHTCAGDVNEMLLFYGTGDRAAEDVLAHQNGLDPRFSKGGFYGRGIYLAEDPSYPIGGRYAHRINGSGGSRVQLLIVKAALGSQQEMGQRISAKTREMCMPDVRDAGPPRLLYDSVRGGPHRPFVSGEGDGCNASIIHVVYESRQMYPAYVIEMEMGTEMVAAVRDENAEEGSASAPAPKRQRHAAPSASGGGGSNHLAALVAAVPPSAAEVRKMDVAAATAALRVHGSNGRVAHMVCARLTELCVDSHQRQAAVGAGVLEAIVAALQAHPNRKNVQESGCGALGNVCSIDAAFANQSAAEAGVKVVVAALRAHQHVAGVQRTGCFALGNLCSSHGDAAAKFARRQRAADEGAAELVVAALRVHPQEAMVQQNGCYTLGSLCNTTLAAGNARIQRVADAGAIEAIVSAMQAHPKVADVQWTGLFALGNLSYKEDARRQRLPDAGAIEVVVAALRAHLQVADVQRYGCVALGNLCDSSSDVSEALRQRAADAGAFEVVISALRAHLQVANVQLNGCAAIFYVCSGKDAAARARRQRAVTAGAIEAARGAEQAHSDDWRIEGIGQELRRLLA